VCSCVSPSSSLPLLNPFHFHLPTFPFFFQRQIDLFQNESSFFFALHVVFVGQDISPIDMINIERFADRVVDLTKYRTKLYDYLVTKMNVVAPNLTALIGEQVAARLISHAGSLTNLAKYPASTVQILGAEKALFRALKTRGNTPKYGLIFHSSFIGRAALKNKGRISRYLANKSSIASRIDAFSDLSTTKFGETLRGQVEDRLKFYDTGDIPKKNVDVMHEVVEQLRTEQIASQAEKQKKTKKSKKAAKEEKATKMETTTTEGGKKKRKKQVVEEEEVEEEKEEPKKKKKKKVAEVTPNEETGKKKKKKKSKS